MKYLFASNLDDSSDQNLLNLLFKKYSEIYGDIYSSCLFFSDFKNEKNEDTTYLKAEALINAKLFLIPSWISLTDEVKKEVELALKQGRKIRIFSHWHKNDLQDVFDFFRLERTDYLWNERIFKI